MLEEKHLQVIIPVDEAARAARERIPVSMLFELTGRCNLNCVHCYITQDSCYEPSCELSKDDVFGILQKLRQAQVLLLTFTGGECLVRSDFADIYLRAREMGFLVTILTNGTLIDDEIIKVLSYYPPRLVEVSLYGMSPDTYEAVTGSSKAFEAAIRGVNLLVEGGFLIALKFSPLTVSYHDLDKVICFARERNISLRGDTTIYQTRSGGHEFRDLYELPPDLAVELEMIIGEAGEELTNNRTRTARKLISAVRDQSKYRCGAGVTAGVVSYRGRLNLCTLIPEPGYDLINGDFTTGWEDHMVSTLTDYSTALGRCGECDLYRYCDPCYANLYPLVDNFDCPKRTHAVADARKAQVRSVRQKECDDL